MGLTCQCWVLPRRAADECVPLLVLRLHHLLHPAVLRDPRPARDRRGPLTLRQEGRGPLRCAARLFAPVDLSLLCSHVLDHISPISSPFFLIVCAFSPSCRGGSNEPQAGTQGQETVPPRGNACVVVTRVAEAGCVCACWAAMAGRSVSEDWHIPCCVLSQQQSDSRTCCACRR